MKVVVKDSQPKRSNGGIWLGVIVVAVIALSIIGERATASSPVEKPTSRRSTSAPKAKPTAPPPISSATVQRLHAEREVLTRALERVAKGDVRGEEILSFYRKHGTYSVFVSQGMTVAFENSTAFTQDPKGFEITIATPEEVLANGMQPGSSFMYMQGRSQLIALPTNLLNEEWLGIFFAHELSHAFDIKTGVEDPVQSMSSTSQGYLDGEVRAYEMENRMVERLSNGTYEKTLLEILRESDLLSMSKPWVLNLDDATYRKVAALFPNPPKSDHEHALRGASTIVALNFLRIREAHLGEEQKRACILAMERAYRQ